MNVTQKSLVAAGLCALLACPASAAAKAKASPGKRYRKAAKRRAIRSHRSKAGRLILQGLEKMAAQQFSAAVVLFEKATKADPHSANAFYHLGDAYYRRSFVRGPEKADQDDAENAVDAYETAREIDPKLSSIKDPFLLYHGLAQCYEALEQYPKALKAIRKAAVVSRANPMPHLYGAKVRYKMRDFDMSSANLYYSVRRARKVNMYPALAKLIRSDPMFSNLLDVPKNKKIIEVFDAVQAGMIGEDEAKERIESKAAAPGDLRDALSPLPRRSLPAVTLRDPMVVKHLDRAKKAYEHQQYRAAIRSYQAALSADAKKGTLDSIQKSTIYERIGSSYRMMGLAGEAIRVLRQAVEEKPDNSAAHYQLSLCFSMSGELGKALTALNKALDTAGTSTELRKTMLMAKTDSELTPVRDLQRYREIMGSYSTKLRARRR